MEDITTNEEKKSFWKSERVVSIERRLWIIFTMLAVFFLGINAMKWTQDQIYVFAERICGLYWNGSTFVSGRNDTNTSQITNSIFHNYHGFTYAIYNGTHLQDYYFECDGNKIIDNSSIGNSIYVGTNWVDTRSWIGC